MPISARGPRLAGDNTRGALSPGVAGDQARPASKLEERVKLSGRNQNRSDQDGGQALVSDVVDDIEDPNLPPVSHLVMYEVEQLRSIRSRLDQKGNRFPFVVRLNLSSRTSNDYLVEIHSPRAQPLLCAAWRPLPDLIHCVFIAGRQEARLSPVSQDAD